MPRPFALSIALPAVAMAIALTSAPARAQEPAQDPAKPVIRLTMSLDAVLPLLDTAVIRVRTPSESQVAAGDATLESARNGVAVTHLTGIRVGNDLAIVSVPDVDPAPASYDVALFDGWVPAPMVATDDAHLYALLRISGRRDAAPTLTAAPVAPGWVVAAVSVGQELDIRKATLDIRKAWLEPGEMVALPAGAAVFAMDGRFAGLTAAVDGGTIIIPGADVLASAEELAAKVKPADAPR